jgi:hypothetical protein
MISRKLIGALRGVLVVAAVVALSIAASYVVAAPLAFASDQGRELFTAVSLLSGVIAILAYFALRAASFAPKVGMPKAILLAAVPAFVVFARAAGLYLAGVGVWSTLSGGGGAALFFALGGLALFLAPNALRLLGGRGESEGRERG